MKKLNTKTIVVSGFLIALNIVLSRMLIIPGLINFGGFPIIFGGIVFGPMVGGIVGAVGDVVSHILRPMGTFMPHFTLTSALTGVIPGILVRVLNLDRNEPSLWKIFIAIFIGQVTTSVFMVPYFRNILFGHPLFLTMTKAATRQAVNIPTYSLIIRLMVPVLYKSGSLKEA
ncbi:MAG: folate family ECF transporter S component [Thermoanaerobacteraceae bacterium]|nr:folate family ECF transporter S component [Thermoanaerobacteraceae bacterium]